MRSLIEKVPVPIAGVTLGLTALGNLIADLSPALRWGCALVAAVLFVLLIAKLVLCADMIKKDFTNPIIASVSATAFMTLMQLAGYAHAFIPTISLYVWYAAIIGHFALMAWFSWTYLRKFKLSDVYPTYFIAFVGIVVASVTSATFDRTALGYGIFCFGFAAYMILLVLVTVRYFKIPVADGAKPLFCIYTAPMSLSLAGYLTTAAEPSIAFAVALEIAAQILYVIVLTQLPKLLRLPFFPSYAAFTFPFVITAIALQKLTALLAASGIAVPGALSLLLAAETVVACVMVGYALIRYLMFLLSGLHLTPARTGALTSAEEN